jgi:hypothetical protein
MKAFADDYLKSCGKRHRTCEMPNKPTSGDDQYTIVHTLVHTGESTIPHPIGKSVEFVIAMAAS